MRLGLFDALEAKAQSAPRLAAALNTDPEMTERLLVALAGMSLVVRDQDRWRNCLPASLYLVSGMPLYQGEVVRRAARIWERYHNLERLVRDGEQPADQEPAATGRSIADLEALHAIALAGEAQRLARLVTHLASRRTLLIAGGAPGTLALALCQRHPALHITLMDGEAEIEVAERLLAPFEVTSRVTLKRHDWRRERWERGAYEGCLLSRQLGGMEGDALTLLLRAYEALKGGGLLVIHEPLLDSDENGPEEAAMQHVTRPLLSLDQVRGVMAEAGFELVTLQHRDREGMSILTAIKPAEGEETPDSSLLAYISPEQEMFALMGLGEAEDDNGLTVQRRAWRRLVQPN